MNLLNYDDVINFLEGFFLKMIKDPTCIHEMKLLLSESRRQKTVPIRAIDELFMMYRKKTGDYRIPEREDEVIWKSLFDVWQ